MRRLIRYLGSQEGETLVGGTDGLQRALLTMGWLCLANLVSPGLPRGYDSRGWRALDQARTDVRLCWWDCRCGCNHQNVEELMTAKSGNVMLLKHQQDEDKRLICSGWPWLSKGDDSRRGQQVIRKRAWPWHMGTYWHHIFPNEKNVTCW